MGDKSEEPVGSIQHGIPAGIASFIQLLGQQAGVLDKVKTIHEMYWRFAQFVNNLIIHYQKKKCISSTQRQQYWCQV